LSEYVSIGNDKLKEFYDKWEYHFAEFENENLVKIEELKMEQE
jgi:hypothetical protein